MTKTNVLGMAVAGAFSLVAGLSTGCGSEAGVNEPVSTDQAAATRSTPIPAGGACRTNEGPACVKGDFCEVTANDGVCTTSGVCTAEPTICSDIAPVGGVCGCDGKDYLNDCKAQQAGMTVAHPGPCSCEAKPDGNANEICASGYYCDVTVSSRGTCGSHGTCTADGPCSQLCSQQPWCGCDGVTYTGCNECLDVQAAGVSMAYKGSCR